MASTTPEVRSANSVTTLVFQPARVLKTPYWVAQARLNEPNELVKISVDPDESKRAMGTMVALSRLSRGLYSANVGSFQLWIEPL